jgi:hypothetical protein
VTGPTGPAGAASSVTGPAGASVTGPTGPTGASGGGGGGDLTPLSIDSVSSQTILATSDLPIPYAHDTGSANTYVVTPSPAFGSYTLGLTVIVLIANTNSGACTLNVNGLGAKALFFDDDTTPLNANQLQAGTYYKFTYTGSHFIRELGVSPWVTGTDTGTANTYVTTSSPSFAFPSYIDGRMITLTVNNTNTGASTLNVNGLGPISIDHPISTGTVGFLVKGKTYTFRYNGTTFTVHETLPAIQMHGASLLNGFSLISGDDNFAGGASVILGHDNVVEDLSKSFIVGDGNKLDPGGFGPAIIAGYSNTVNGTTNLVIGTACTTSSNYSFMLGVSNVITGFSASVAIGTSNQVAGYGIAIGTTNILSADDSFTCGNGNHVLADYCLVFGNTNHANSGYGGGHFVIGNGNTTSYASAVAIGNSNNVSKFAFAFGNSNILSGRYAGAFGNNNHLSGTSSFAFGNGNTVTGQYGFALGNNNNLTGVTSLAIGDAIDDNGNTGASILGSTGSPPSGFAARGSKQREEYIFFGSATSGSAVRITTTGDSSPVAGNTVSLPNNSAAFFSIKMIAYNQTTKDTLTWRFTDGLINRGANAASTTMSSDNPVFLQVATTPTPPSASVPTVTADTTRGSFNISWTPPNSNTWNVVADLILLKTAI